MSNKISSKNPSKFLSRRDFLKTTALGSLVMGASFILPNWAALARMPKMHKNPLAIPPLEKGKKQDDLTIFDLEIQDGVTEFFSGTKTATRGVNGSYLGPTLRMNNGDRVRLNVKNSIGETTTLHWHGLHIPAKYDGGPHQPIKHNETWSPEFTIMQKAANFWYHPHLMGKTAEHVWQGIAGLIIIDDEESKSLALPNEYGIDDIPLVLQDRRFFQDGSITYSPSRHDIMMGMVGGVPLANGTITPYFKATKQLLRLRLLNGANASIYELGFSDGRVFKQIATDGSMLEKPFETSSLLLAPGERAEIIVDVRGQENFMLVSKPAAMMGGNMGGGNMGGGMMGSNNSNEEYGGIFNFLEIQPVKNLIKSPPVPMKLTTINWLDPKTADNERSFEMAMQMGPMMMLGLGKSHTINGKSMKMKRIDETIKLDAIEIWELSNISNYPHPFHVHDVQFQIISRNGKKPHQGERGLKDTVLVNPNEIVRFIAKFDDFADPDNPYMYHCHILEHEDAGMMGQFVVV